ncbi:MAG: VanZ family protein [Anaerolineae bacterium]|jgi:VanZ family protein|nr:VanZ family protein [Anaerolineae bacterium]
MPRFHILARRAVLLTWGPVLVMMAVLFIASAQPKYEPPGGADRIYFSGLMPVFPGSWEFLLKKSGHMIVFGLLALSILRALLITGESLRSASYLAILITVGYALTDEYHQSFITGRYASLLDIGFDTAGAIIATLGARCVLARRAPAYPGAT